MRTPMTEDEMQRELRRGNRFNLIAFIVTVLLTVLAIVAFFCLDRYIILTQCIR